MSEKIEHKEKLSSKIKDVLECFDITLDDIIKEIFNAIGERNPTEAMVLDELNSLNVAKYSKNRNYPLRYIKAIIDLVRKQGTILSRWEDEVVDLWKKIENTNIKHNKKRFINLEKNEILWIANNIEKLNEIPFKYSVFMTYLSCLCSKDKIDARQVIRRIEFCDEILKEENRNSESFTEEGYWEFIDEKDYLIRNEIDALIKIVEYPIVEAEKIKEEKDALVKCWLDFRKISDTDKQLLAKFAEYSNNNSSKGLSDEQIIIIGVLLTKIYS